MLRVGPYGEAFGAEPDGLSLDVLERNPHGVDLGPLEPRIPEVLRTASGKIELAPEPIVADVERLSAGLDRTNGGMVLIGRRQLRSNNSWLHNSPRLMKGADRCTALVHPEDARARGIEDGTAVRVSSAIGAIEVPAQVSDEVRPGVVSVPHGFGHGRDGVSWRGAAAKPGASVNDITDPAIVDRLTGNAAFNAVPVRIEPVEAGATSSASRRRPAAALP
jgi:anaerobic selenocysteine-containing dehydrogenase